MAECPHCFEEMHQDEMTFDPDSGNCCIYCAEYFQYERDEYDDNMRKLWKHEMISLDTKTEWV